MKTRYLFITIICLLIIASFYFLKNEADIEAAANVSLDDITKIKLYYGRPGQEGINITDKETVAKFINMLKKYKLQTIKAQPIIAGYYQAGELYKNDEKVITIIFGNPIEINGIYYRVVAGEMNPKVIDEFIKQ